MLLRQLRHWCLQPPGADRECWSLHGRGSSGDSPGHSHL